MFFLAHSQSSLSLPSCCYFLFPPSSSLISPLLQLFLTSCLPNLFFSYVHTFTQPVRLQHFMAVCVPPPSLLHSPLVSPPFSFLRSEGLLSCWSTAQWPSIHQSVTAHCCGSVCPLLNNCPGEANNISYTQTHTQKKTHTLTQVEPGVLLQQGRCSPCTPVWWRAHRMRSVPSGRCQWAKQRTTYLLSNHRYQAWLTFQYKPILIVTIEHHSNFPNCWSSVFAAVPYSWCFTWTYTTWENMTFYFAGDQVGLKQHGQQSVYGVFMVCQWGQLQDGLYPADLHWGASQ